MQDQRVIITGANGLLGLSLLRHAPKKIKLYPTFFKNKIDKDLFGHSFSPLDVTKKNEVLSMFDRYRPTVIIHAASLGNVDQCEKNPDLAFAINVDGTKHILAACEKYNTKLLFTSDRKSTRLNSSHRL